MEVTVIPVIELVWPEKHIMREHKKQYQVPTNKSNERMQRLHQPEMDRIQESQKL